MIDLKQLLKKAVVGTKQPSAVLYWDKEACGFVSQQNKERTFPEYSKEQVDKMIASGKITVGEDGLPKVIPRMELTEEEKEKQRQKQYEDRVKQLIRQRYSQEDENGLLRQRDRKTEEFEDYDAYCEECKAKAKAEVYGNEV